MPSAQGTNLNAPDFGTTAPANYFDSRGTPRQATLTPLQGLGIESIPNFNLSWGSTGFFKGCDPDERLANRWLVLVCRAAAGCASLGPARHFSDDRPPGNADLYDPSPVAVRQSDGTV
jgi:hypothetical protein